MDDVQCTPGITGEPPANLAECNKDGDQFSVFSQESKDLDKLPNMKSALLSEMELQQCLAIKENFQD